MKILITGGTGSLGKALIKAIPASTQIIVYSRDEGKHAVVKGSNITNIIGDIRDFQRLHSTVGKYQPNTIIHAAALKRVDDMELAPFECIKTNIIGSQNIVEIALENKINKCILISTDKACHPINAYGATKFLAEKIFINMDYNSACTKFAAVRYGNVIASRGSFIPIWKEKISKGEKVDITSESCTRYLFSLQDAANLVLKCVQKMQGGEIFVPRLKSYNVFKVYKLICKKLEVDYNDHYNITGMRPGEKINEDLLGRHEVSRTKLLNDFTAVILPEITNRTYHYHEYDGNYLNSKFHQDDVKSLEKYI